MHTHQNLLFLAQSKTLIFRLKLLYIYVAKDDLRWEPIAIGEEIPIEAIEHKDDPNIHKINLFDLGHQLPPSITLSMDDLIQIFFEYGIGKHLCCHNYALWFLFWVQIDSTHFLKTQEKCLKKPQSLAVLGW